MLYPDTNVNTDVDADADVDANADANWHAPALHAMCVTYFKQSDSKRASGCERTSKSSCRLSAAQYKTICWRCHRALLGYCQSFSQSIKSTHIAQLHIKRRVILVTGASNINNGKSVAAAAATAAASSQLAI